MRLRSVIIVLLAACAPAMHASAELVATRIDAANHARLSPGGADATGGIGDWALSDGTLCAVVADAAHESDLAPFGGGLVDLGHCGRGDDQLVLVQPLANLDRRGAVRADSMEATASDAAAQITTRGTLFGCDVETVYRLDRDAPGRLRITTHAVRRTAGERLFALGDVALHAQHALRPFAIDSRERSTADAYSHPAVDLASPLSIARATGPADTRILVGAGGLAPGIAYALRWTRAERSVDGTHEPIPVVSLSAENFSGLAAFAAPFWFGGDRLGSLQILQTFAMDLAIGTSLSFEREILVSPTSDVASLTDRLLSGTRRIAGRVADPRARLFVRSADGHFATDVAPEADGSFAFRMPKGAAALRVLGSMSGETAREIPAGTTDLELGDLPVPPLGTVDLPQGHAMRLTFLGIDGTPDPRFGDERPPVAFGTDTPPGSSLTRDISLAGAPGDPHSVSVAPGRYRVLAGRGPEFGVTSADIEVTAGARVALAIEAPARVLDTPGWISADLHVHAAPSDDSAVPQDARLRSFLAEGAEVLVATDHETVTDYAPLIHELGVASRIASVAGQEVTSSVSTPEAPYTFGHANAFPLVSRPAEYRRGALPNEARRLRDVIDQVRALGGDRIVQLNHARSGGDAQGFFDHLSVGHAFEPDVSLGIPPNAVLLARASVTGTRDLDFDAMELLNGPSMERYRQLRADWFALLRQGVVRTATANSDSHLLGEVAAAPRNLVRLVGDDPDHFDPGAFVRALRAGHVVGTTGPILDVHVGDAGPGENHRGREGAIRVDVRAAPWVPVARVRAYVNGALAHEIDAKDGDTIWFPHRYERDAFVTVEVEGVADATYAARLPKFTPFAFSNPVFVDADEDGTWQPVDPLPSARAMPTPRVVPP